MLKIIFLTIAYLLSAKEAYSCASCGSGGDSPLVLFPGENKKVYLGVTNSNIGDYYDAKGKKADYYGIENKQSITAAAAYRVVDSVFTTLTLSAQKNEEAGEESYGMSDPLLSVYYLAMQQNFLEPFRPQISIIAQYKPALMNSSRDIDWSSMSARDVFSDGLNEVRLGVDSWFFTNNFLYGLAFKTSYFLETEVKDGRFQREPGYKAIATGGYAFGTVAKLIGGYSYNFKGSMLQNRELIDNSEIIDQSLFLSWYQKIDLQNLVRLTYSESGLFTKKAYVNRTKNLTAGYLYLW